SEKDKPRILTEEQGARARVGWKLLEGFITIPGAEGTQIDIEILNRWADSVRKLAAKADRLRIAEEKIGTLLAHAPPDPDDQVWPHKTIRELLQSWQSQ